MPSVPWNPPRGLDAVVADWLASARVRPHLVADHTLPASEGVFAELPEGLDPRLRDALARAGVDRLYAHQAAACAAAMRGRHVVVATPTASGKSLCFHLPILDALARDRDAAALYLFPTKALARDQEASVRALVAAAGLGVPAVVYDGDTPGDARRAARERSPLVITNPDMLHAGILPHHAHWARTFKNLRYVVVDELHTYRGVFGSHVAHVLARLRRAAAFHGASPTFLCATATIGNPREHAARLLGVAEEEVTLVDRSAAPRGARRFLLYNPPVVNAELGIRASCLKSAVSLAADLLRARVATLLFGPSRNSVETMLKYLRDALAGELPEGAIMGYRGGYLPEARRRIERGLREGEILGVVATHALELGIDVGELDAVVCAGYPGSIAASWQRFGRAGRRGGTSVALLVASSAALDQYLARTPAHLLGAPVEHARIDPDNPEIAIQHLKCAAFELPFLSGEPFGRLGAADATAALRFLADRGVVHESGGRFHWAADAYPAHHVSLRSVGWDNFVIVDRSAGRLLGELDWRAAPTMLHEQAIYQHDGEQYQVERLDFENHKAYVTRVEPDYFTEAMSHRNLSVLEEAASRPLGAATVAWGEVALIEKVVGYKKIRFYTHENAGYGEVRLPDTQMHTTSFWLVLPPPLLTLAGLGRAAAVEGLRGLGRALETVAALELMCDPRDLGRMLGDDTIGLDPAGRAADLSARPAFDPTLYLFDTLPGGVGLAERIYERADSMLARAGALIASCPCADGCPACVGPTEATDAERKRGALRLLASLNPALDPAIGAERGARAGAFLERDDIPLHGDLAP